jgi:hypothetical protein
MLANPNVSGSVANISAVTLPVATSNSSVASQRVTHTNASSGDSTGHSKVIGDSPNTATVAICSQWNTTGLSMKDIPVQQRHPPTPRANDFERQLGVVRFVRDRRDSTSQTAREDDPRRRRPGDQPARLTVAGRRQQADTKPPVDGDRSVG